MLIRATGKRLVILITGIIILVVLLFGPYGVIYQTSKPAFCNLCHVMHDDYESWFLTGVHRSIACVDCHLPNNSTLDNLTWKSIDGMKDVISFFNGIYPDDIHATGHAKKVIKQNCIRCHGEMVSRIDTHTMDCWSCHRKINHKVNEFSYSDIK